MIDWRLSASAILGVLLSVILAHRLTLNREKAKSYQLAVIEFKNMFVPFLQQLEEVDANPEILVVQNYPKHEEEARKLVNVLPKRKTKKFKQSWGNYNILFHEKNALGSVALTASIVEDISRAHEPGYIYKQNTKRRHEVVSVVNSILRVL